MSDLSSLSSLPPRYKPKRLRGGDSSTDAAIIAIVVVIIVILLVAIILAACWGGGRSDTETIYVMGPDGQPVAATVQKRRYGANKLKELPGNTPRTRGGKTYELAGPNGSAVIHHLKSESEARNLLADAAPAMLFIYMDGCGYCDKVKQYYDNDFAAAHPNVKLAAIEQKVCQELCKEHGITGFPTFLTNFTAGTHKVQSHVGYKPAQAMSQLLASASGQQVHLARMSQNLKSGVVTEFKDGGAKTGSQQAQDALKDKSQKVILFLYAPWCGYCKKQKPVLDELAAAHPDVKFCAINADEAGKVITQNMKVRGFPTFIANFGHEAGENADVPKVYSGYRDAAALKQQILKKA